MAEVGKLLLPKSKCSETDTALLASIDLLTWFAADRERYRVSARRIPFLTEEETLQASEDQPAFLLPCSLWDTRAQPYQAVFPRRRVLSEVYMNGGKLQAVGLLDALVAWRIAHSDLLFVAQCDLDGQQIAALCTDPAVASRHKASDLPCSTVAFLNEVLGATAQDRDRATLLLQLVLDYVIHQDPRWRQPVAVLCSCGTHPQVTLPLYASEWLAALLLRDWVGSKPDGQGKTWAQPASRDTLNDLIDWPAALVHNLQVQFLTRLGFDTLDLTIRSQAGGSEASVLQLRQQLANLVAAVGLDAKEYANLIAAARDRACQTETVRRNQILGLRVQRLIEQILRELGFDRVVVRHRARDLEAHLDSDLGTVDVGSFSFEVKASKGDEVKMSPAQVEFVVDPLHQDSRVLCVVDLQNVALPDDLTTLAASVIEPHILIVDDIGETLRGAPIGPEGGGGHRRGPRGARRGRALLRAAQGLGVGTTLAAVGRCCA